MGAGFTTLSEAGLTPQIPIVTAGGTPTVFFFRWLLALRRGALQTDAATAGVVADDALFSAFTSDATGAIARSSVVPRPEIRDVLGNIPNGLNQGDAGQLFTATDYEHRYRWTGSAWKFLEGDASGYMVMSKPDGTAPNGGLWGLCDGTAYNVAQPDGTVASVTTLPLSTPGTFLTGDASGAAGAASAATWAAGAVTDPENLHTHSVDPPPAATSNDNGPGQDVPQGTGAVINVAAHPHNHSVDIAPFNSGAGSAHSHALSATAQLNPPSAANGGLQARIGVRFYIRR